MILKVDVLADLFRGRISPDQAYVIYEEVKRAPGGIDFGEPIGLSRVEWTAFGHGVGFETLAKWRYEGWPSVCPVCRRVIEIEKFGWLAKASGKSYVLVHIGCLDKFRSLNRRRSRGTQ